MGDEAASAVEVERGLRIAYQGEPGAFSEEAIQQLGPAIPIPCSSFGDLFSAIADGRADRVVAPVENTIAGPIIQSCELLARTKLQCVTEIRLAIRLHLIGLPGASLADIRKVRSHPVALAQCERYFSEHANLGREAAADTAGSVREMFELGDRSVGAIASERAAALYGGVILARDIHDNPENFTKFLVLAAE